MALTVCTWLWGTKYGLADVAKWAAGVRRHLRMKHRLVLISDRGINGADIDEIWPIQDVELTKVKGCFARLRMFDPLWQAANNIDRLVCMDLDSIVTGPLDPLFARADTFTILGGANAANPCPFNGSLMMLRAGYHSEVWTDFSMEAAQATPHYEFPDDQGWIHHKLPNASTWQAGSRSGVYAFKKPGWPEGNDLPANARLVVFPGWRSPEAFKRLDWIKQHWVA